MMSSFNSIVESERKCKSDNEAKKGCKVMALDDIMKILDDLRSDSSSTAVGLTFR
jgi:hypothetical protein